MEKNISGELAYYRDLARLRGELVGYLMAQNRARAGETLKQIEALGTEPPVVDPIEAKKQRLKDAMTALTRAIEEIVGK